MLGADLLVALTNTSVALAGATVVAHDLSAGWLLLPPAAVLLLAYRAWVSERAKHQSLEFLYGVTRSLSHGGELEAELLDLLRRTRSSFRVRTAELVRAAGAGRRRAAHGARAGRPRGGHGAGRARRRRRAARGRRARRRRARGARALRARRCGTTSSERGIEQALIAPVRGETPLAGVMVLGDRIGATDTFTDEDLRLFEALAAHAGLSLELDRLERQAQSDPLTGLANRTLFLRRVEASLERGSGMATVLFLDLDDFKAINDRAGHAAGDAVLVAAAGRIEASVRPGDIAARMGGDEFAVLLEDVDDHHGEQVAGRILDLLAEPVVVDGEELWVRSSVGIATAGAGSLGSGELLHRADVAMYRAKEAGKSQMRVWFPEMHAAGEGAPTGRDELADALRRGELVAHFQPIVSLVDGTEVAAEALARWRHPRLGLLGAGSFVPDAEGDLAAAVDREVLFQACAAAARGDVPAVHVNLAALDAGTVRDVLESTGLDPARLVLELSERALAAAPVEGLAALRDDRRADRVRRLRRRAPRRRAAALAADRHAQDRPPVRGRRRPCGARPGRPLDGRPARGDVRPAGRRAGDRARGPARGARRAGLRARAGLPDRPPAPARRHRRGLTQPRQRAVEPVRHPPVARPSSCITAGTSTIRTIVASTRIAVAMPMPISFRNTSGLSAKAPKTATMIAAAAVITRAVRARPSVTALGRVAVAQVLLAHAREQEHLVVHREAEQDREHDHRDERRHRRRGVDARSARPAQPPSREQRRPRRRRRRSRAGSSRPP